MTLQRIIQSMWKKCSQCAEQYIAERRKDAEGAEIDERLVAIVDSMFQRCIKDGSMKRALGIALESRRIDIIEDCLLKNSTAAETRAMLQYAFDVCRSLVTDRAFRRKVLETIVSVHMKAEERDHICLSHCLQALDKPTDVADMLQGLLTSGDEKQHLLAYQVAFDLCENENQQFLINVDASLKEVEDGDDALVEADCLLHSILVGGLSVDLYLDFLQEQPGRPYPSERSRMRCPRGTPPFMRPQSFAMHTCTVEQQSIPF